MTLNEILTGIDVISSFGPMDIDISSITSDSRKCVKDGLFIAMKGFETDGHEYIGKAISLGVRAIIYEDDSVTPFIKEKNVSGVLLKDSRRATAFIADNFFDHPSRKINLIGVTGTNGKTTIATLLYDLFRSLGYCCGLLSTIANYVEGKKYPTINTTQDPITINSLFAEMADKGCEYCFMEVSSHSLEQGRVAGLKFKGAIFTNLTHDHLDYHKTYAEYIRCKKLLFDSLGKGSFALTNADDKNGDIMVQNTKADIYRYSSRTLVDFNVKIIEKSLEGSLLNINGKEVWSRFIGAHNAHNIVAVYGTAILLGADSDEVLKGISALKSVSGRLEYIKGGKDLTAVVDYAHTPDALENVLSTLKDISCGNDLVAVFGCGGNRDKTKRPEMAAIGAQYADKIIITSDNPRYEDPEEIIKEMKAGLDIKGKAKSLFITDRREAIRTALMMARQGSIILVAGKGHEDYQIVKGIKSHFDDKEIINECFNEMKTE